VCVCVCGGGGKVGGTDMFRQNKGHNLYITALCLHMLCESSPQPASILGCVTRVSGPQGGLVCFSGQTRTMLGNMPFRQQQKGCRRRMRKVFLLALIQTVPTCTNVCSSSQLSLIAPGNVANGRKFQRIGLLVIMSSAVS
jgi:hypothetical protein